MRKLARDYARLHELDSAIDWALSRDPTMFTRVGLDYYIWKTTTIAGLPAIEILFYCDMDAQKVLLIRGRVVS